MAEARGHAEFSRVAYLAATIINSNPFREGETVTPAQLMGESDPAEKPVLEMSMADYVRLIGRSK